jgi:pyruvate/2-oxoglutarate dehydrogenase complex dihydrolipoamide acyltransferase (E2) component
MGFATTTRHRPMKLMNHIDAEIRGRIVEILVSNGDAVEFEMPLMRIAVTEAEDVT